MLHTMDSIGECQKTIVENYPAGSVVENHYGSSLWELIMEIMEKRIKKQHHEKRIVEPHHGKVSGNSVMEKSVLEEHHERIT